MTIFVAIILYLASTVFFAHMIGQFIIIGMGEIIKINHRNNIVLTVFYLVIVTISVIYFTKWS